MKGDRHRQGTTPADAAAPPSSPPPPQFIAFQRRTTPLDWRRIASLDVEKVVREGDPSPLEELTTPILFCKAEEEFDRNQTDAGFIKVFRLAQLIGEYLQVSLRQTETRLASTQKVLSRLEAENKKFTGETKHLRDHLTLAKKELRRRRELLESKGGLELPQSPLDEYHQCPYCVKRFLISIYLYAHLQRRHQGLPIVPLVFPLPTGRSSSSVPPGGSQPPILFHGSSGGSSILNHALPLFPPQSSSLSPADRSFHRRDSSTQTPGGGEQGSSPVTCLPGPIEPNSGRSEGEVRQEDGDELPGTSTSLPSVPRTDGNNAELNLKSSSEEMTVIKSPPSCWNRSANVEEGEVPPDEEESEIPFASSSKDVSSGFPGTSRLDIKTICEMIETFLEEKSLPSRNEHYQKILSTIEASKSKEGWADGDKEKVSRKSSPASAEKEEEVDPLFTKSDKLKKSLSRTEQVEEVVMRMKDQFESQWQDLSERVKTAGLQNSQGTLLLSEIKKVQDILNSPCRTISSNGNNQTEEESSKNDNQRNESSSPGAAVLLELPVKLVKEVVEERLQKQSMDLAELKSNLELKMETELEKMKARLEEQNILWRQQLLLQQSVGVTNLQQSSPGKKADAAEPNEMQIGTHPQFLNVYPGNPDQSVPAAPAKEISSHELNMTSSSPSDTNTNKAADSTNDLSHQISLPPEKDDVIVVPVPKPRKPPSLTSTVISRVEIPGSHNELGFPKEISYVRRDDRRQESGEPGETEPTLIGRINHLQEMQNEIVEEPKRADRVKYLETGGNYSRVSKSPGGMQMDAFETDEETGEDEELSRRTADGLQEISESVTSSQFTLNSEEEVKEKPRRVSYVFDDEKGRLVGDWEVSPKKKSGENLPVPKGLETLGGGSQLELVRKRTLEEVGEELQRLEINPEAEAISLEEMARALRHLKTSRPSSEGGDQNRETFKQFRSEVRENVNEEVRRRSIRQKLEQHGSSAEGAASTGTFGSGTSPLAKMLHKVKKSGNTWKKKVASAMRRKQKSPKNLNLGDSELKTSFFSKSHWVKRRKESPRSSPRKSQDGQEKESSSSSSAGEEEESSMELEMPPFLTKSKPLLEKPNDEELMSRHSASPNRRKEIRKSGYPAGKSKLKDDYSTSNNSKNLIPPSTSVFSANNNNNNNNRSIILPSSSSSAAAAAAPDEAINKVQKCPNFFVKESAKDANNDNSSSRVTFPRVTSNGWSSNAPATTEPSSSTKFFSKSTEELIGANSKASRRHKQDEEEESGKKKFQERHSISPANERQSTVERNKSWRDDLLAQLSSSSSSTDSSDSEDSSSSATRTSVSSGKKNQKKNSGGTFSRNENNRVAFRKRHTSTSLSDEEEYDTSLLGKRRVGGFGDTEVKGGTRKKVVKTGEEENSSDTSIWEDVDEDVDGKEEEDDGESESRDLPPPPTQKNANNNRNATHRVVKNSNDAPDKVLSSGKAAAAPAAAAKTKRTSSPPTNSWDSS